MSGVGSTGSRKISRVPPDRHGLCTTVLPGWSASGLGAMRSSIESPSEQAQRLAADGGLGALPADEAVDRPVGGHERPSPGLADVGRSARTTRRARTGTQCARSDSARSCSACVLMAYSTARSVRTDGPGSRATFAGVSGMSA